MSEARRLRGCVWVLVLETLIAFVVGHDAAAQESPAQKLAPGLEWALVSGRLHDKLQAESGYRLPSQRSLEENLASRELGFKQVDDGGNARNVAVAYASRANALQADYPKVARVLRALEDYYKGKASRDDVDFA